MSNRERKDKWLHLLFVDKFEVVVKNNNVEKQTGWQ